VLDYGFCLQRKGYNKRLIAFHLKKAVAQEARSAAKSEGKLSQFACCEFDHRRAVFA
jgi:hypothetical protein